MANFFRNCIKYIWIFIILIIATVALNYFFVIRNYTASYKSTTSLLVSKNTQDIEEVETYESLQSLQISEKLVFDIPEIIYGSQVLESVNNNLSKSSFNNLKYTVDEYRKNVSTEIVNNTRVVNITVKAHHPEAAQLIASSIANATEQEVREIMNQGYIRIIKKAHFPLKIDGLLILHLWILSVLGGIGIGFTAVLAITMAQKY